jgi:hypothetical protein
VTFKDRLSLSPIKLKRIASQRKDGIPSLHTTLKQFINTGGKTPELECVSFMQAPVVNYD